MTLRVLLVDDHTVLRSGLKAVLESPQITIVGEAGDGVAAIELVERLRPDVVVMDASLPRLSGAGAIEQIRKTWPEVKVLVLTASEKSSGRRALRAASGLARLRLSAVKPFTSS